MSLTLCNCQDHSDHADCSVGCVYCFTPGGGPTTTNSSHVSGSYVEGRNLSKFDQDILKILCAVLKQTGPVTFNMKDIEELDVDELVVESTRVVKGGFIASYGEVTGVG